MKLLIAALLLTTTAQANPLYALCKGQHVSFAFTGESDTAANITITTGKLEIAGRDAIIMAPTDGFFADSDASFKLGSSAYSQGEVTIAKYKNTVFLRFTENDQSELSVCETNLLDGKIVEATAHESVAGYNGPFFINRLKQQVREQASKLCDPNAKTPYNVALIGPDLLDGYTVTRTPVHGETINTVSAKFRCL